MKTSARLPRAFTLIELLVVIGIIGALLAILLPMAERVRHRGYIDKCASNLRTIGQALAIYADENHGVYPRTRYTPGCPDGLWHQSRRTECFRPHRPRSQRHHRRRISS